MARINIVITRYGFNKPPLFSEEEYISYKQILNIDPNYNLAPNVNFWDEFVFEKWCLISLVVGLILGLVWEPLLFIPSIALLLLIGSAFSGSLSSMWNFQRFIEIKNKYYNDLKQAIQSSNNYSEFVKREKEL